MSILFCNLAGSFPGSVLNKINSINVESYTGTAERVLCRSCRNTYEGADVRPLLQAAALKSLESHRPLVLGAIPIPIDRFRAFPCVALTGSKCTFQAPGELPISVLALYECTHLPRPLALGALRK
ncbi:hypothetical protein FOPG_19579 [Fusarium oxysporum f. sp. conglutinans race 2 54008]|uniref:Uncharacterized protein n=1 Tax=Fusarium oxysporum f. sp. conglutinans race 2 54008 TaxID=1089457 RepID=X0GWE2_FUSOX|nr:hypothetical protein FOPG_19579 [Fusarium oxysporum f. sp. conglutinans race 2 54008]